ncbi:proline iminopeptidase [Rhizoclosmatium globosum]|uniref:Proline iminopeptidase n=1 Tax=Rhizoclosmatium globosum TaxID=329046 RepID=A0A1Y2BUJ8_9FUNG|nr:proline iminopeptidase [Rhizoclosmatium globosum]|eukprot:ORY38440.1 proline iminopeptidase [Rhizoclosmatium globosum]
MSLYPAIEPFHADHLKVSDIHSIWFEQSGNEKGKPVVFVHGGPGFGYSPEDRLYFDPAVYRIIIFDQRGAGKSLPTAELKDNNTWALVEDMEKLRIHLGIDKWIVFGGSWGSTLGLTYAIKHPTSVKALILRGIFTLRKSEVDWLYQEGASHIFPDYFDLYAGPIPIDERHDILRAYYKRLTSPDLAVRQLFAKTWSLWEMATIKMYPDPDMMAKVENLEWAAQFAAIECHYFVNDGFYEKDGWILENIGTIREHKIPGVIVQGRYDVICPTKSAYDLHKLWPEADFQLIPDAGHSSKEPGIIKALVDACETFKSL